jgi:hypothetical protein
MAVLPVEGQINVANRLGWLNIFGAANPYFTFDLSTDVHDHRMMLNMLYKLSKIEKGGNGECPHTPCGKDGNNLGFNDAEQTIPSSRYRCRDKRCDCHWYPTLGKYIADDKFVGFHLDTYWAWNDPKFPPKLGDYRPDLKDQEQKEQQGKKAGQLGIPRGGRYQTRFFDDPKANGVNAELRSELTARYCLQGVPRMENSSNKLLRQTSYGVQGLLPNL